MRGQDGETLTNQRPGYVCVTIHWSYLISASDKKHLPIISLKINIYYGPKALAYKIVDLRSGLVSKCLSFFVISRYGKKRERGRRLLC